MTVSASPDVDATVSDRLARRLVGWISFVIVVGVGVFGWIVVGAFNRSLAPELERRADLLGVTVRDEVERALDLGIPLDQLVGVDAYFRSFLDGFSELERLAILDPVGVVLYETDATHRRGRGVGNARATDAHGVLHSSYPVVSAGARVGTIEVGVDRSFARSRLVELMLDMVVILIVTVVTAFEVTVAVSGRIVARRRASAAADPQARHVPPASVGDIRLVVFVFAVGEELNKSFLPLLVRAAHNPFPWLDADVAVSLPIVAYLATLALVAPLAGGLVDRFGQRTLFLVGIIPAAASHLGMIVADDVLGMVALRALTGVGYGLATIACQEYLLDHALPGQRARSFGVFVTTVIGGTFAGTALGGIFADRLGYSAVFVISFAAVLAAGLLALTLMRPTSGSRAVSRSFGWSEAAAVVRSPPLLALLTGVTIPMNVLMAAFLWYLVPLSMAEAGADAATIARALMLYYLVILVLGPAAGAWADRTTGRWPLVASGTIASGIALLLPTLFPAPLAITAAVLAVGVGHAIVRGPQVALALDLAESRSLVNGRGAVLAAMRSLERIGSLLGLLVVSVLAARLGLPAAMGAVAVATATAGLVFLAAGTILKTASAGAAPEVPR